MGVLVLSRSTDNPGRAHLRLRHEAQSEKKPLVGVGMLVSNPKIPKYLTIGHLGLLY